MKSIDPSKTVAKLIKLEAEIQENQNFRAQLLVRIKEHTPAMMKKGDRWKRRLKSLLDSQDKEYSQKELQILQTCTGASLRARFKAKNAAFDVGVHTNRTPFLSNSVNNLLSTPKNLTNFL